MWLLNPYRFGDPDAAAYIAAVEAADGQVLEAAVASSITNFVVGCKTDGTWNALKASCIMAGARTLAGALVPLRGTAPTNFNFVAGDYNRKTGLVGDGSSKYLDTNRNNNADPPSSKHLSVWRSQAATVNAGLIGSQTNAAADSYLYTGFGLVYSRLNSVADAAQPSAALPASTLIGATRSNTNQFVARHGGVDYTIIAGVNSPASRNIFVFSTTGLTNARLSFYSIGEAIGLALLDARLTTLMNALAAAIP
jgi:hypothetical protein